jgi:hypothetical protein
MTIGNHPPRRNASNVSSVSNRAVFCLSGQQFIFFVFFIFTNLNFSRCSPKRLSYLSFRFIRQRLPLLCSFCWMNALIPSFSVSTMLSFQILFLHILEYSGFDLKNVQITRSAKGFVYPYEGQPSWHYHVLCRNIYRGADKSLARPGRKKARTTEYFEFHISYL